MADPQGLIANSSNFMRITLTNSKTGLTIPFPDNGTPATVTLTLVDNLSVTQLSAVAVPFTGTGGVYEYNAAATAFPQVGTYTATWIATDPANNKLTRVEPVLVVA